MSALASPTLLLVIALLLFACIAIYYASLPKPLPGIPYDKESARKPFGDLPAALAHVKETGVMMDTLQTKWALDFLRTLLNRNHG